MLLLEAIAHQEGFDELGSRPARNLNPGDLEYGPETVKFGATRSDGRFAIFPDIVTGWNALRRWLSIPARLVHGPVKGFWTDPNGTTLVGGYLGATLAQAIYRFAPPSDGNNTEGYIAYVSAHAGIDRKAALTLERLTVPPFPATPALIPPGPVAPPRYTGPAMHG